MWTRLLILASRIRSALFGRRLDADFRDELQSHLDMLAAEELRKGVTPAEANRRARLRLGGIAQLEENNRRARGLPLLEETMRDIRYALRSLRKNPVFSAIAIATLAIGIGAGTVVFTFAGAVLLRPLPYERPDELVRVFETNPLRRWTRNIASPANYADWRAENVVFVDMAAYEQYFNEGSGASDVFLTGYGDPQPLKSLGVTGNLFQVLGAQPLLGRTFTDEETFAGKARVVILSYGLWQSAFAGDPAIIGRSISLSGATCEVVGVMPREFFFPGRDVHVWIPVAYSPNIFKNSRRPHWLGVIARRKPDVTLAQAGADMDRVARALEEQYPDTNTRMGVHLEPFQGSLAFESRPALLMLSASVGLLFLIVCANIANLQLGRAIARGRELAIRRALGASRTRLVRQLLIESLVLSVAGGAFGFALTWLARAALARLAAPSLPPFAEIRLDRAVALFAAALSLSAPIVFGIMPALTSSRPGQLSDRTASAARDATLLRNALVAAEVALSIILVVGSVLLVRSLVQLGRVDPGFNPDRVIALTVTLPSVRYPDARARFLAFTDIERRIREEPGVQSAGASSSIALRGATWTGDLTFQGRAADDYERDIRHSSITPDYFKTMGIRLLSGRMFDERDRVDQPRTTIVNEAMVRKFFRGADPIGVQLKFARPQDNAPWIAVVGVVADEKQDGLDRDPQPLAYQSIGQQMQNPLTFVVRTSLDAPAAVAAARRQVAAVDKDLALTSVATLQAVVDDSMGSHRFRTLLLSSFAAIALLLAALGTYGVLAYSVSQRARELAIRLALGARRAELFRLVIGQGLRPVALGAVAGLFGALALTSLIESLLFGVTAVDPPTYALAMTLLAAIGAAACAAPAWRATRVDPLRSLREE